MNLNSETIFLADFHVHSRYSMATSRKMDLENLYIAAQTKGLDILATGDFTHPGWLSEIRGKMMVAEEGLYRLKWDIERQLIDSVPESCRDSVRFILISELSCIYKQDGKTRKGHYLVFMPNIEVATRFCTQLSRYGNLSSDGRPILGISAYHLLEMVLNHSEKAFLVPAHIWTPWFSIFGSRSGFDTVEECFGDLSDFIFALETGLSSDPPMNRAISGLDRFSLISNSDAHSPQHLGREANIFQGERSFTGIRNALDGKKPENFLGTIEFFPQEGKYYYDGHQSCNVCCHPSQSKRWDNRCPVCGKPLTIGVLNRCRKLSDRGKDLCLDKPFLYTIPLCQMIAQVTGKGIHTKTVQGIYTALLSTFGPELELLHSISIAKIKENADDVVATAIDNMRNQQVRIQPGYDGIYGKVLV